MLCLCQSIIERGGFDHHDFLCKYHQLVTQKEYLPPSLKCIEKGFEFNHYMKLTALKIGLHSRHQYNRLPMIINPYDCHQSDSEPIYRITRIVLRYYQTPDICLQQIETAVRLTHISPRCVDTCRFYASLMIGALMGVSKHDLLSAKFNVMDVTTYGSFDFNRITPDYIEHCQETIYVQHGDQMACRSAKTNHFLLSLYPPVRSVQLGNYKTRRRSEISSENEIIACLEASLWSFYNTRSFEEGCIRVINLGEARVYDWDHVWTISGSLLWTFEITDSMG